MIALGSIFWLILFRADMARRAPSFAMRLEVRASFISAAMNLARPSAVLSAILPVKPSVTTTSTVPLEMSVPSTNP